MPESPSSGCSWVFLVYPLTRIFYDAFTDEAGAAHAGQLLEFFTDRFYLRSLGNSHLVLGVATGDQHHACSDIAVAFLLVRYDFPRARSLRLPHA